ncbi:alpha/beta fold hydrolase [Alkalibacter saccharofermentans]|uniref:Pimeloyl-ACP methyl ester carboxylesterase n=1 Tax=Alkalibacter saccharofermentans DSM 14828 TaxID=1120975 RepID=A0A1M4ZMW4_9FIRM|nr:alpha/beta hydrolase [Alkalibacter saccharofermentans]SHF19440.1 Pimeloyl-ACP methyl ester carboxylesterase [Alkalibacter saccharofermentans DSM 14828]
MKIKQLNQRKQEKPKMKRKKKIMMIFKVILGFTAVSMVIGATAHATYFKGKLEQIKPYGQIVDVDEGQMHLFSIGNGEKTIVLLPGMGVALPSADFSPLMRKLSEKYTVVTVEYFGVGFSSQTDKPRTTDNYVEEIRTALREGGFEAPYVLMPHSISSVYSEYFASKYPDEVEAIISLDGTSTAFYEEMPSYVKYMLPVAKLQQSTGTLSLLAQVTTNKQQLLTKGYTEKEISDMVIFGGFTLNENVLEQIASSSEYIRDTMDLPFPESVSYFKVISKETYETPNKQLKMTPQKYQYDHLERIGENVEYEILDGNHFIYANNADRILEIVDSVLIKANQ